MTKIPPNKPYAYLSCLSPYLIYLSLGECRRRLVEGVAVAAAAGRGARESTRRWLVEGGSGDGGLRATSSRCPPCATAAALRSAAAR